MERIIDRPGLVIITDLFVFALMLVCSCKKSPPLTPNNHPDGPWLKRPNTQTVDESRSWSRPRTNDRYDERLEMVKHIRSYYSFSDTAPLDALSNVPRHWFVPSSEQRYAYTDGPLPIGHGQTISQPYIVAFMTGLLELTPDKNVLEIGTGSGYQAAVLNELTPHVYTIEIIQPLANTAQNTFKNHGYRSIKTRIGDGYKGWDEYAPFDAIIVTCAADQIPPALIDQLKIDGKMIIPVGHRWGIQQLVLVTKDRNGTIRKTTKMPVRFVPLIRENP